MSVYPVEDQDMHEHIFRRTPLLAPSPAYSYDSDSNIIPAVGYLTKKHQNPHHPTPAAFTAPPSPSYYDYPSQPPYQSPVLTSEPSEPSSNYSTPEPVHRELPRVPQHYHLPHGYSAREETKDYDEPKSCEEPFKAYTGAFKPYKRPAQQQPEEIARPTWSPLDGYRSERAHGSLKHAEHRRMSSPLPPSSFPMSPPVTRTLSLSAARTNCMAIGSLLLAGGPPAVTADEDEEDVEMAGHPLVDDYDESDRSDDNSTYHSDREESYRSPYGPSITPASFHRPQLTSTTSTTSITSTNSTNSTPTTPTTPTSATSFPYTAPFRHRESSVRIEDRSCGSLSPPLAHKSHYISSPGISLLSSDRAALAALDASFLADAVSGSSPRLFSRSDRRSARKPVAFRSPAPIADPLLASFQDASIAFHQEMSPRKRSREEDDTEVDIETSGSPSKHFMYTPRVLSGSPVCVSFHEGILRSRRECREAREGEEAAMHNHQHQQQHAAATKGTRRAPQVRQYVARRSHPENDEDEGRRRKPREVARRHAGKEGFAHATLADLAEAAAERVSPQHDSNGKGPRASRSPHLPSRDRSPASTFRSPAKRVRATSHRSPHTSDVDSSHADADSEADELEESDYEGAARPPVARVRKVREGRARVDGGGRQGKTRGPCQACGDAKDTCIRKGYDWPFPVAEMQVDSKGIRFVSLCNKCGLRWQKSKGSICHCCKWILFKEERKKAVQCIDRMRRSRPAGEPLDPEEDIEGFACSPKGWPCGRPWKVGWIHE